MSKKWISLDQLKASLERVGVDIDLLDQNIELVAAITEALDTRVGMLEFDVADLQILTADLGIPDKVSDLLNDLEFQTKTEVAAAIAAAQYLKRKKVPNASAIDPTAEDAEQFIYMVPQMAEDGSTYYQDYMVIDGTVEPMGDSKVNLEGYLTEDYIATDPEVDEFLDGSVNFDKLVSPAHSNKNLFRNWCLLKPINQRGKDSYAGVGYGYDCWYSYSDDATVSATDEGLSAKIVGQILYASDLLPGTYTVSGLSSAGFRSFKLAGGGLNDYTVYAKHPTFFSKTFTIGSAQTSSDSKLQFQFSLADDSKLQAVKLEPGVQSTLCYKDISGVLHIADAYDYGEELRRCGDILEVIKPFPNDSYARFGYGHLIRSDMADVFVPLKGFFQRMPRLETEGVFQLNYLAEGVFYNRNAVSVTLDRFSTNGINLLVAPSIPGTAFTSCEFLQSFTSNARLVVSTEPLPS